MKKKNSLIRLSGLITSLFLILSQVQAQCPDCQMIANCTFTFQDSFAVNITGTEISLTLFNEEKEPVCELTTPDFPVRIATLPGEPLYTLERNSIPDPDGTPMSLNSLNIKCLHSVLTTQSLLGIIGTIDVRDDKMDNLGWELQYETTSLAASLWLDFKPGLNQLILTHSSNVSLQQCEFEEASCPKSWNEFESTCATSPPEPEAMKAETPQASSPHQSAPYFRSENQYNRYIKELESSPPAYSPLSATQGKIKEVFLMDVVATGSTPQQVIKRYAGILRTLAPTVKFHILMNFKNSSFTEAQLSTTQAGLYDLAKETGRSIYLLPTTPLCPMVEYANQMLGEPCIECEESKLINNSQWAQDPFLAAKTASGEKVLISPLPFSNFTSSEAATQLSASTHMLTKSIPLKFEGGNMLVTDSYMLVGADELAEGMEFLFGEISVDHISKMRKLYALTFPGHNIEWVGDTTFTSLAAASSYQTGDFQPFYHLDLFITPLGASPHSSESFMVGELEIFNPDSLPYDTATCLQLKKELDEVANTLSQRTHTREGFTVKRIPLPMVITPGGGALLSLNNCLLEIENPTTKRVYLPTYHGEIPTRFWKKASLEWKKAGFQVVRVPGYFNAPAVNAGGSLHCMTKVIARE